jgi:hypothetical protein
VLLLECLVFVALCFGLVYAIMNQRVTAIPAVGAIAGYRKAESDKQAVIAFADMVSNEMETWSWWNAMDNVDRVKPFLDPEIRGPYESAFSVNLRDSKRYAQRSVYERVKVEYKGVVRESVHKIIVFYQVWVGRGKTDRDFTIDRISRRAKILEHNGCRDPHRGVDVVVHPSLWPVRGNPRSQRQGRSDRSPQ